MLLGRNYLITTQKADQDVMSWTQSATENSRPLKMLSQYLIDCGTGFSVASCFPDCARVWRTRHANARNSPGRPQLWGGWIVIIIIGETQSVITANLWCHKCSIIINACLQNLSSNLTLQKKQLPPLRPNSFNHGPEKILQAKLRFKIISWWCWYQIRKDSAYPGPACLAVLWWYPVILCGRCVVQIWISSHVWRVPVWSFPVYLSNWIYPYFAY